MVEDVMIINFELPYDAKFNIIGSDLHVGDNEEPNLNTPCGADPKSSGVYSCGGKVGKYLGIVKNGDQSIS